MTKGEEQEQTRTAEQEIEVARQKIAKCVNENLPGADTPQALLILATVLERVR